MKRIIQIIDTSIQGLEAETKDKLNLMVLKSAIDPYRYQSDIHNQLMISINNMPNLPTTFDNGKAGLLFAIEHLLYNGILEMTEKAASLVTQLIHEVINYTYESPVRYNCQDSFYPLWILIKPLADNSSGVNYYHWQENLIMNVVECEAILTRRVPYIHNPADLGYGMLHSIYCFAKEAEQRRIYTFKAHEIQQIIKNWPYRIRENNPAGKYILDFMVGREVDESEILRLTDDKKLNMLAEVGLYAFLYEMPALFKRMFDFLTVDDMRFYQLIERELSRSDVSARMVIGIGLGVITCEKNAKD